MSLAIGILGLPNVGKSTLFRALTKNPVDISNYPFCTVEPNVGIVQVPDVRLEKIAKIIAPEKIVPAAIKFTDVAGLVRGAAKGEGLGNQFLAHLRETDALLHIVRCFRTENVAHIEGTVEPARDIKTIESELIFKDLETVEARIQKIEKDVQQRRKEAIQEYEVLQKLREKLYQGETVASFAEALEPEKRGAVDNLFLLTSKTQIYLFNGDEKDVPKELKKELDKSNWLCLNLQEELDKAELTDEERQEFGLGKSRLEVLIKKCYEGLNLLTFFTVVGGNEVRAWNIFNGGTILEGAGKIHSDFREKFIRAEVVNWQDLVEAGSVKRCVELGLLKQVGRDYILKDGDVVEIKI